MAFKCPRWTFANVLPVAFVLWVIITIWVLYCWLHLAPLLQLWTPPGQVDKVKYQRGFIETWISQTLTALLMICFLRAVCTDPGSVPETPEWAPERVRYKASLSRPIMGGSGVSAGAVEQLLPAHTLRALHEVKQTGERRFCKWCNGYKPDRCHHCRVCKSCVLRMDHHCPWIANCVGFRNHKYFFLLVFYALLTCCFIIITMAESLSRALEDETPSAHRFLLVFGMTLSVIMGILLKFFFAFHLRLMLVATTTIEFCEKRHRYGANSIASMPNYHRSLCENIQAVLGPWMLLWLLPVMPPVGDGLYFRLHGEKSPEPQERPASQQPSPADQHLPAAAQLPVPQQGGGATGGSGWGCESAELPAEPEQVAAVRGLAPPEVTGERAAAA